MIQASSIATHSTRDPERTSAILTGIVDTRLIGRDRIEVKFSYGDSATAWLSMNLHDFLHFGHFVLALRTAMDHGLLAERNIDQDDLRKSWEPRRAFVERRLCNPDRERK